MIPKSIKEVRNENLQYVYPKSDGDYSLLKIDVTYDETASVPQYQTEGAAGMDLVSSVDTFLPPKTPVAVKTGVKIAIPKGYEGQIRPRSGLALQGVTVWNSPGTIDEDFRGEIKVILMYIPSMDLSPDFAIKKGDRIAQLIISKVEKAYLEPKLFLDETIRGSSGFGSTGK